VSVSNSAIRSLSEPPPDPTAASRNWSVRLEERYRVALAPDLADWFDSETWRHRGAAEFNAPVDPATLLSETPDPIWPALMPPDFLPVLGNAAGDWLCVRVDRENAASELVHWYHGGGDWIPWGRTLSEAILLNAVHGRLPGPRRRHAEGGERRPDTVSAADDRLLAWAREHLPGDVARLSRSGDRGHELAEGLLECGVAEPAVRCELVQAALDHPLSLAIDPAEAAGLGLDWDDVVEWIFDLDRTPRSIRVELSQRYGVDPERGQDWITAANHCRRVTEVSPELGWAWDLLGYDAQRRGAIDVAVGAYRSASTTSVFTDQSIRLRTHWFSDRAAKFSIAMLNELAPQIVSASEYLRMLTRVPSGHLRGSLTAHWRHRASRAVEEGDLAAAYDCLVAAGWDLGGVQIAAYERLLEEIGEAAEAAGFCGRAATAKTHLACLRDRYDL